VISWKQLKERRIFQMVVAYLAVGWVALSVVDQFVDRNLLPEIFYLLGLVVYLGGIPAALILGWYHGEKGSQEFTAPEMVLLSIVGLATLGVGGVVFQGYLEQRRLTDPGALNAGAALSRVAVLYFDDLSTSADLAYMADGMTEALIDELSGVRALDVVSRNGAALYRDGSLSPDSIGRALSAGSVITGSVEQSGDVVRVNVRLVDAQSGVDIDRASFGLPEEELLQARDSLVSLTAEFLRARLGEEVLIRGRQAETGSVDAWTHVQRAERLRKDAEIARLADLGRTVALLTQADSLLRTAEVLDDTWAEPLALRAQVALQRGSLARSRDEQLGFVSAGVGLADRAIERDPGHANAWEARGTIRFFHYFLNVSPTPEERAALLDAAQADLERAVELDPDLAGALNTLSRIYYYERGDRISGALAARQALQADSYLRDAASTYDRLFWSHYDLGQFAEAGRTCSEAAARFSADLRFRQCQLWMMITPSGQPDPDAAWAIAAQVDSLTSPDRRPYVGSMTRMIVGGVLARANLADSARSVLLAARADPDVDPGQELPGYEAIMRTILGDLDQAVQSLRRYVVANPDHEFIEVEGDLHWWWRPLRDLPGFDDVVARGS
jgi:TolB-like protein